MARPTLLLTRPREGAENFAAQLDPLALDAVHLVVSPLMEIVGTGCIASLEAEEAAIFTSGNGVQFAPDGRGRSAFCVGQQTTQRAAASGWDAHQVGETAQELIAGIMATPPAHPLVHLGGVHTRGDISKILSKAGVQTRHVALYDQELLSLTAEAVIALQNPSIVPVFSPRTAERLVEQSKGNLGAAHIVALSETVAAPFRGEKTAQVHIMPAPEAVYMTKVVENLCGRLALP